MKTLKIIERTILSRTGSRRFPYKKERQVTIVQGEKIAENHLEDVNNPRLKVKFVETFKTRSIKKLEEYISQLGRTDTEKWIKSILEQVMEGK